MGFEFNFTIGGRCDGHAIRCQCDGACGEEEEEDTVVLHYGTFFFGVGLENI